MSDSSDNALVVRDEHRVLPPMEISGSLRDATATSFVHVDRKGKVRSRARYKALRAFTWGAVGVVGMAPVIYGVMFGAAGVVAGGGLVAFLGWRISHGVKLQRAVRLIRDERVSEALELLGPLSRARMVPRATRALVEHNIAVCHTKRGDFETALVHWEKARKLYGAKRNPSVFSQMADYSEIKTLVNVGRVGDARGRLAAKGDAPEGDYLQLQHWVAELYVMFASGEHDLTDDELFARARVGLELTVGAPLLALTAWAHHASGDDDQAWHLLGEALDRSDDPGIEQTMPLLHAWMHENADLAEANRPEI